MTDLPPVARQFILHWGEMGSRWGINRSVAQIHALLYLSEDPLPAEEIAEELALARSNVSTSLRELQAWGIVRVVHVMGDRRDLFESLTDVWEMFQIVMDERKRREIDPTIKLLAEALEQVGKERRSARNTLIRSRLQAMLDFFETADDWYSQVRRLPPGAVVKFMKMGGRLKRLLAG